MSKYFKTKMFFICIMISKIYTNEEQVILIPHSHDDLGWLNTIEGYYRFKVEKIFNTVLDSLEKDLENNNRKFVYSEVGYLKMYINRYSSLKEEKLKRINNLIKKGKFEFINGGMSQADSASPFYEDIMENYFYGLSYLKKNFNSNSKGGWQIDPFGHSKCLSYLARLFGMEEIVINRIGYVRRMHYGDTKNFTMDWNFHDGSKIRTHLCSNHYSSPGGMGCDGNCDFNQFKKSEFDSFLKDHNKVYTYSPWYFFGGDFEFSIAENNFDFIDKVLDLYPNVNYGLFSDYINLVNKQQKKNPKTLLQYEDDFFVYEEGQGDSWSGYFTSKQRIKKRIRSLGIMLRSFKQIVIRKSIKNGNIDSIDNYLDIAERFGSYLHHDCITGTAKRFVDKDYLFRMYSLEYRMTQEINKLFNTDFYFCRDSEYLFGLEKCEYKDNFGDKFILNVYNPSAVVMKRRIKFVLKNKNYFDKFEIINQNGEKMQYGQTTCYNNKCEYFIMDTVKAFSLKKYSITILRPNKIKYDEQNNENEQALLNFEDHVKNNVLYLKSKGDNQFINEISVWTIDSKSSGAYILKYDNDIKMKNLKIGRDRIIRRTENMQVLTYSNADWSLVIINDILNPEIYEVKVQINNTEKYFKDGVDLVLKINNPNLKNSYFTTDSNGMFTMKRKNGKKFETSVYPMTSDATIKDENSITSVLAKNAQGVINPEQGVFLIYLERSSSTDDHKGVDELLEVNNSFITTNYVINSRTEEEFNENLYSMKYLMDVELLIMYSKNKNNNNIFEKFEELDSNDDLSVGEEFRINVDFIDEKNFFVRVQNVRRDVSVNFDKSVLKSIYGDLEFNLTSFENVFYNKNQILIDKSNFEIKPLEFKLFQVELL